MIDGIEDLASFIGDLAQAQAETNKLLAQILAAMTKRNELLAEVNEMHREELKMSNMKFTEIADQIKLTEEATRRTLNQEVPDLPVYHGYNRTGAKCECSLDSGYIGPDHHNHCSRFSLKFHGCTCGKADAPAMEHDESCPYFLPF